MPVPGPSVLGRGVVIDVGGFIPHPWAGAPEIVVDAAAVAEPVETVAVLHEAWAGRRPVVVRLAVTGDDLRAPATTSDEPWRLGARFEPHLDRLHFLVWANTYDARGDGPPVWWWARKAGRLGATVTGDTAGGAGDVVLPDGTPAWIDGGPRGPLDPSTLGAAVVHRDTVELGRLQAMPEPRPVAAALAPDQLAAVGHGAGPARIVAPAGSGKTRVLTERLRHLVVDRGYEREALLAVAYNKKAQLELEARCADVRPRVSTLNALGYRLLGEAAGRSLRVVEEREARRLLDDLLPRRPRRSNTDPVAPYLEGLAAIRLGLRDPAEVEAERDDVPGLADVFPRYRRALGDAVDFDEQVYRAIEVLLRDGELRRRAQAGCRHLLVDEFQDLTPAHVLLLRILAIPALDVFGVGDDDQVIYGHAGADPGFLIGFEELFPGAVSHPLQVNYRCPVAVVDAARTLLSHNHRRVAKEIRPGPAADPDPSALALRGHPPEHGASELVAVVSGWLTGDGCRPEAVAVLTRVNALLLAPHVALAEAGIAVSSTLPADVLDRTGIRAALAYLRLGAVPGTMRPDDLVEVLRRPSRGLPQWFPKWLRRPMSVADVRDVAERLDDVKVAVKVRGLADDLERVAGVVATGTTRDALAVIADEVGLGGAMQLLDGSKGGQTGSQLDDLDALAQVADLHPDPATFEGWLRDVLTRRPREPDAGGEAGVTLSTVHRVKGMEWDRVVVFGVTAGVVPHRLADDVEEERRVLHVALTRARHRVVVLGDSSRPSPFLAELDGSAPKRPVPAVTPATDRRAGPGRGPVEPPAELPPEAARVQEALRAWRLQRSRTDGVPAFVVASNAVLRAIAARRPATLAELATIGGIGPTKLDLYGDEILAVVDGAG